MNTGRDNQQLQTEWYRVSSRLKAEIGDTAFENWVKPMSVSGMEGSEVRLSVPSRFMRDWVEANYLDRLKELWAGENAGVHSIEVRILPKSKAVARDAAEGNEIEARGAEADGASSGAANGPQAKGWSVGSDISAPLDPHFNFSKFVVGKPNEFAYAAARRVAEAQSVPFNPLFLYGGVGLGKTHLMHAIAWEIQQRDPARTVMYLSAEKFMYRFVRALREQNTVDFKDQFRSVDVLMIDDVQFIGGRDATQEEFFHTFNALVDQGRQIILSADKSPSDLEGVEDRLKSRLNCGLVADIHATTYELRLAILESKAEQMQIDAPRKVLEFLAHKITANVRELEGALNRVAAHTQLIGRELTLETTQEVLHDLLRANDRRVTIEEIQKRVAEHFNIRVSDMHSARRARSVARPRQVAMYLAKQLTSRSLPEIGRKFGGRDHTTVMHAVKKVDELRDHDSTFAEDVELLRRMLEG
ncbi:MAG: chromosomal replication initiator protein DnaA [Rhodospirillales bacterium]|jgi:chromosomal replication initiator protein|nr:chromosomal replication initiator protein DnaA [Rhodospirillaceae bacterium]MDP6427503.1 chromosomal replication initiator protein DnaA [Rhodospirillales bacterium]MDP6646263.1 chromosomal replication initiator protein DnaA [Rhodospirillales bacterium]MDP6842490.1 chromosomal replication initiator protein DnaA [Rhodospirillales bacterium]|tara:strand:+ start:593 stop:2008 length:1416 start_codon:yes stop_codon:yes gene_type:complete